MAKHVSSDRDTQMLILARLEARMPPAASHQAGRHDETSDSYESLRARLDDLGAWGARETTDTDGMDL